MLAPLEVHVSGIGGPGAPHRFRFMRQSDFKASKWERPPVWRNVPEHPQDVILTVWQRMSAPEDTPSQPSAVYLPYHVVVARRSLANQTPTQRRNLTKAPKAYKSKALNSN